MKNYCICFILFILVASCAAPKTFEYRDAKNISMQKMGLEKSNLKMDLEYFNPNHFGLELKKMEADVYIEQHYVGKMNMDSSIHIPRFASFSLPTKIELEMKEVYKNAISLALKKEVQVTVKGTARIGHLGIYKTIPFVYDGKQPLKLF